MTQALISLGYLSQHESTPFIHSTASFFLTLAVSRYEQSFIIVLKAHIEVFKAILKDLTIGEINPFFLPHFKKKHGCKFRKFLQFVAKES